MRSRSVAQGVGELLVLARGAGELVAGLDELLLEHGDLARRAGEATPEQADLFLQEFHLGLELVDLLFVPLDLLAGHRRFTSRAAPECIPGL